MFNTRNKSGISPLPCMYLFSMYYYILYYTHLFAIYQFSETLLKTVNQNSKRTIIIFIYTTQLELRLKRSCIDIYAADAKVNQIYIYARYALACLPIYPYIMYVIHEMHGVFYFNGKDNDNINHIYFLLQV
jgi:hypothetical protein